MTGLELAQERKNTFEVAGTLAVAWLVPGGAFLLHGRFWRGLGLFAILNLTFLLGCLMLGGVTWPTWSIRHEGFNIINNITFIIQMGLGLPALLSLYAGQHPELGILQWAAADPSHALYDLGSFYLLVAGAMNYFILWNSYDRLFGPKPPDEIKADAK